MNDSETIYVFHFSLVVGKNLDALLLLILNLTYQIGFKYERLIDHKYEGQSFFFFFFFLPALSSIFFFFFLLIFLLFSIL